MNYCYLNLNKNIYLNTTHTPLHTEITIFLVDFVSHVIWFVLYFYAFWFQLKHVPDLQIIEKKLILKIGSVKHEVWDFLLVCVNVFLCVGWSWLLFISLYPLFLHQMQIRFFFLLIGMVLYILSFHSSYFSWLCHPF